MGQGTGQAEQSKPTTKAAPAVKVETLAGDKLGKDAPQNLEMITATGASIAITKQVDPQLAQKLINNVKANPERLKISPNGKVGLITDPAKGNQGVYLVDLDSNKNIVNIYSMSDTMGRSGYSYGGKYTGASGEHNFCKPEYFGKLGKDHPAVALSNTAKYKSLGLTADSSYAEAMLAATKAGHLGSEFLKDLQKERKEFAQAIEQNPKMKNQLTYHEVSIDPIPFAVNSSVVKNASSPNVVAHLGGKGEVAAGSVRTCDKGQVLSPPAVRIEAPPALTMTPLQNVKIPTRGSPRKLAQIGGEETTTPREETAVGKNPATPFAPPPRRTGFSAILTPDFIRKCVEYCLPLPGVTK